MTRQAIALAQIHLNLQGFDCGNVDGLMGPATKSAIKQWQLSRGHTATGVIDTVDFSALTGCPLDLLGDPDYTLYLLRCGIDAESHRAHGVEGDFIPQGIVIHHTSANSAREVIPPERMIEGHEDLSGPLVQFGCSRNGRVDCYTNGRAHHAGSGDSDVLRAVMRQEPLPPPEKDDVSGNTYFLGIEVDHCGDLAEEPIKPLPWNRAAEVSAALCLLWGWSADHVIGHREWTKRKVDPVFPPEALRMACFENMARFSTGGGDDGGGDGGGENELDPDLNYVVLKGRRYRLVLDD